MADKKIKMFATDLDGTLFSGWATVSSRAAEDLRRLRKQGVIVVVCSGRPFYSIRKNVPDDIYDYAISMNGQDIYDCSNDKHITMPFLDKTDISTITAYLENYPMIMETTFEDHKEHYSSARFRPVLNLIQNAGVIYKRMQGKYYDFPDVEIDYTSIQNKQCAKLCFMSTHKILNTFVQELDPTKYSAYFTNRFWVEIQRIEVSKGNALKTVMEMESIQKDEVAAAGDGEDDLPMLEECGVRIAMANAMPKVKEIATDHAGHSMKDGLAQWIETHSQIFFNTNIRKNT